MKNSSSIRQLKSLNIGDKVYGSTMDGILTVTDLGFDYLRVVNESGVETRILFTTAVKLLKVSTNVQMAPPA